MDADDIVDDTVDDIADDTAQADPILTDNRVKTLTL